jgi:hypothetical protein
MVWPFSKRRVIDLTDARMIPVRQQSNVVSNGGYADLTNSNNTQQSTANTSSSAGVTDFFSAVSDSASTSSFSSPELEAKGIKNKIEDVEYKLQNLTKKLNDLLDRFEVVERRVTYRRENN